MPYKILRIGETPYYHVVNTENGHIFSKHGLTYARALAQLRALHIHEGSGGKIAFTLSLRDKPPPSVRKILEDYGEYVVKEIYVCREPIEKAFDLALTALTLGKFKEDRKKYNIDTFFHLYTIFTLTLGGDEKIIRLEKNEVINAKVISSIPTGLDGRVYHPLREMTFQQVFNKTEAIMGHERFIHYSIYTSNCQDFALSLAEAVLGVGNIPHDLKTFIKQEHIEDLVPKQSFSGKVAEKITKWAGIFDHIFHGSGVVCQYCTPSPEGSIVTKQASPEVIAEWKARQKPKKKSRPFGFLKYI